LRRWRIGFRFKALSTPFSSGADSVVARNGRKRRNVTGFIKSSTVFREGAPF
jgi:hypothetical protein